MNSNHDQSTDAVEPLPASDSQGSAFYITMPRVPKRRDTAKVETKEAARKRKKAERQRRKASRR